MKDIDLQLTPSKPVEDTDAYEELILTPSVPDERPESSELLLEAENFFKAEEITFDGEEEAEERIAKAMSAYDKAMDEAAQAE